MENLGPVRPRRFRASEDTQSLIGALVVIALLPFIFGMVPLRALAAALLGPQLGASLGLGASDLEAWQSTLVNFAPFGIASTWRFLGLGLMMTVGISFISILLSIPLATMAALARISTRTWLRISAIAGVEGIRAFPVLILIFYVFVQFSVVAEHSGSLWLKSQNVPLSVIIALTLYTTVVNAETIRAGILSLSTGQMEAARSLGLPYMAAMWYIILPQTFRRVLPPLIAQFTTLVKDTSLGAIVGLLELYHRGQILYQFNRNPMETFFVISVIYFILNYLLGQAAQAIERRVTRSRMVATAPRR